MFTRRSLSGLLLKAALIIAATAAVSFVFWYPIQRAQRAHIERVTRFAAQAVRTDITDEIRAQLLAQVQVAQMCSLDETLSKREWDSYASPFLAHHPGYVALLLTDNAYHVRLSYIQANAQPYLDSLYAPAGPFKQTLKMDPDEREVFLTPAFFLRNGRSGHGVVTPIHRGGLHTGFVIAILDDQNVLEDALADQGGQGYGLAVFEDDHELYRLPGDKCANEKRWGQDADLPLSAITWHIRVWPHMSLTGKIESRLPELALSTGAAIGMLLASTLVLAWTAYVKSREVGRAHDRLEFRVQERTSELESLNTMLEAEVRERREAEQSLRDISGRLLQVRDEEQRRIAREVHDGTAQLVGALAINLERLLEPIANGDLPKARFLLAQSSDLAEQAAADLRTFSHLLHPPILDDLGLDGALPWYTRGFSSRSGIIVNVDMEPQLGRFPREVELTLFRILQEALTNIYRHSGSSTANLTVFRRKDEVTLQISDHGRGIPSEILTSGSYSRGIVGIGIAGIRERVRQMKGKLEIESGSLGTCIKVVLPIVTTPASEQVQEPGRRERELANHIGPAEIGTQNRTAPNQSRNWKLDGFSSARPHRLSKDV
jgi:signal transduction histidine kinase